MAKAATLYTKDKSTDFARKLDELAAAPKGLKLSDLVMAHKAKIEQAIEAGYTHEDIVAVLKTLGITIAVSTLQQYLRVTTTSKAASPAKPRTKTTKDTDVKAVDEVDTKDATVKAAGEVASTDTDDDATDDEMSESGEEIFDRLFHT